MAFWLGYLGATPGLAQRCGVSLAWTRRCGGTQERSVAAGRRAFGGGPPGVWSMVVVSPDQ
jgi:hypothetical protein